MAGPEDDPTNKAPSAKIFEFGRAKEIRDAREAANNVRDFFKSNPDASLVGENTMKEIWRPWITYAQEIQDSLKSKTLDAQRVAIFENVYQSPQPHYLIERLRKHKENKIQCSDEELDVLSRFALDILNK